MSNIWSSVDREKYGFVCPVCHKVVSAQYFESHRMKEIEEEKLNG